MNALRSSMAFSYNDNLRVHLWYTYGETPSSFSIVMSNIAEILEYLSFLMPALLKRLIVFSTFVTVPGKRDQVSHFFKIELLLPQGRVGF